jgi:hypothetical protein
MRLAKDMAGAIHGTNTSEYIYSHFMFGLQFHCPLFFIVLQWSSLQKNYYMLKTFFTGEASKTESMKQFWNKLTQYAVLTKYDHFPCTI